MGHSELSSDVLCVFRALLVPVVCLSSRRKGTFVVHLKQNKLKPSTGMAAGMASCDAGSLSSATGGMS